MRQQENIAPYIGLGDIISGNENVQRERSSGTLMLLKECKIVIVDFAGRTMNE